MGEVPEPPMTGLAPLLTVLHPTILRTVMLMLPSGGWPPPAGGPSTWLINACRNPSTVTTPPPKGSVLTLSKIGMVTIELLVVTRVPLCCFIW